MKFQSQIISRGSGSIGGLTASHNKGGNYFRARTTPTNPGSVFQTAVRNAMASLVNIWSDILTQAQRDDWDVYALNTPLLDTFGLPRTVTGLNMYCRANVARIQSGETRVDEGPVEFNTGQFTAISQGFSQVGGISTIFTNTDLWANEDNSAMLIYTSRPQNASIKFFKGPYRLAGVIQGDAVLPPTSPVLITPPPFSFTAGQRLFGQVRVTRADGRLSVVQRTTAIAIA